jgi:uncharacterized protein (DUF2237 family)
MDGGKHTLAAVVTAPFLAFSKKAGNDLSTPRPDYGFAGTSRRLSSRLTLRYDQVRTRRMSIFCP